MARIRSIKPEFWRSPATAEASPWARLLYIAMWNWADDYGRAEWTPRELLGFAFPHDSDSPCTEADFPRLVAEVQKCFEVKFYVNGGRRFYEIPAWSKHQKTEKRAGDRFPHSDDPNSVPDREFYAVAEIRGFSEDGGGNSLPGTRGTRGTGEQEELGNTSSSAVAERGPDLDALFESAYASWPKKVERKKSLEKFKRACKKRDPEELVADIRRFGQAYAATTETQFVPALNVWLNGERWTDALPLPRRERSSHDRAMQRQTQNLSVVDHFRQLEAQEQKGLTA